jgi:hypothetical protein
VESAKGLTSVSLQKALVKSRACQGLRWSGSTRFLITLLRGLGSLWSCLTLVACRREFVTTDAVRRIGILPVNGPSIG